LKILNDILSFYAVRYPKKRENKKSDFICDYVWLAKIPKDILSRCAVGGSVLAYDFFRFVTRVSGGQLIRDGLSSNCKTTAFLGSSVVVFSCNIGVLFVPQKEPVRRIYDFCFSKVSAGCMGSLRRSRVAVNGAAIGWNHDVQLSGKDPIRGVGFGWMTGLRAVADWDSSLWIGWMSGIAPPPPEQSRPRRPRVAAVGASGGTTVSRGRLLRTVALRSQGCFFPFCDNYFCGPFEAFR